MAVPTGTSQSAAARSAPRVLAAALLGLCLLTAVVGCGRSTPTHLAAKPPSTAGTTAAPTTWGEQARSWLAAHAADLTAISASADNLGQTVKAGKTDKVDAAIAQFVAAVGHADVDLPKNAFGQQVHQIFISYVVALTSLRNGITNNDKAEFQSGSVALSSAVAQFSTVTKKITHAR